MSEARDTSPVERILDATWRVIAARGVAKARAGDIADEAGLGRATLYRYFATREDIFVAYAEREMERFLADLLAAAEKQPTQRERVIEGVALAVEGIAARATMAPFFEPEALPIAAMIPGRSTLLLPRALAAFDRLVAAPLGGQALNPALHTVALAEWLVRMILSLAMMRGPKRSRSQLRAFIGTLLSTEPIFLQAGPATPPPRGGGRVRQK